MKCPVCTYPATRHYDHQHAYWFCNHCWQEVPEFDQILSPGPLSSIVGVKSSVVDELKKRRDAKTLAWAPSPA